MRPAHPSRPRIPAIAAVAAIAFASTACATTSAPSDTPVGAVTAPTEPGWEATAVAESGATPAPVPVTVGLPYKPDVQFTPMYVAQYRGYFAEAGLDVEFVYGDESSFIREVAARRMSAVVASGEQVIMARAQGIPVKFVATWYERFPGVVFSDDPLLDTPQALVGKKVGLPVLSGASYIGWRALLASSGIDPSSIETEVVGFNQLSSVMLGQVDAAVGYAANEPVQMRLRGVDGAVIEIADSFNLVSNGIVVGDSLLDESPEAAAGLVRGFLRGLWDSLDDAQAAFDVAAEVVPEIGTAEVRDSQRAVLEASLPYWRSEPLGAIDPDRWQASQDFLITAGLVEDRQPVEDMIDDSLVRRSGVDR